MEEDPLIGLRDVQSVTDFGGLAAVHVAQRDHDALRGGSRSIAFRTFSSVSADSACRSGDSSHRCGGVAQW